MRTGSGNRTVGRSPGSAESATHAELTAPSAGIPRSRAEPPRRRRMLPKEHRPPSGSSCSARQSPAPSHPLSCGGRFYILLGTTPACVPTAEPIPAPKAKLSSCGAAIAVGTAMARYGTSGKAGALFRAHGAVWGWAGHC